MLVSKCCKDVVYCASNDCASYYVCNDCNLACDVVFSLDLNGDSAHDDTGNAGKIEAVFGAA